MALSDAIVPAYTPEEIDACEVYTPARHVGDSTTLPKTNSSPLKMGWLEKLFPFGAISAYFQGYTKPLFVGPVGMAWAVDPNPRYRMLNTEVPKAKRGPKLHKSPKFMCARV